MRREIIQAVIPPLDGMTGIRLSHAACRSKGAEIKLELKEDSQILIGYIKDQDQKWLQAPKLETNAHADDRGGFKVQFGNAVLASDCPAVDIHALQYEKGVHELYLGTGSFLVIGIVPKTVNLADAAGKYAKDGPETLDWLYTE